MTNDDVKKIVQLRDFVIEAHNALDGGGEPAAVVKQQDVAHTLSTIIKSIDDLIKQYVTFSDDN